MKPRLVKSTKCSELTLEQEAAPQEPFPPENVSKRLSERLAKSLRLREKPQDQLQLFIQVRVLNAVVKGIKRGQEEAKAWIALDTGAKIGQRTDYFQRSVDACISAEKILWNYGYTKTFREEGCETDECNNVIQSRDGRVINSLTLVIKEIQEESYDSFKALNKEWRRLNKLLPPEEKRAPYKKKSKKK